MDQCQKTLFFRSRSLGVMIIILSLAFAFSVGYQSVIVSKTSISRRHCSSSHRCRRHSNIVARGHCRRQYRIEYRSQRVIHHLQPIGNDDSIISSPAIIVVRCELDAVHVYLDYLAHLCTVRPDNARFGVTSPAIARASTLTWRSHRGRISIETSSRMRHRCADDAAAITTSSECRHESSIIDIPLASRRVTIAHIIITTST